VFSINLFIGAASLIAFTATDNFWLAIVIVAVFGFSSTAVSICSQTLIQHLVAGHMRARVMGLLGVTFRGVPALGALIQGWAASLFGISVAVGVGAGLCLIVWPAFANILRLHNRSGEMERPEKNENTNQTS